MLRLIVFVVILTIISMSIGFVSDNQGSVNIQWLGYQIETSILFVFLAILLLITLSILLVEIPLIILRYCKQRKYNQTISTLTQGFTALLTHDKKTATKASKKILKLLGSDKNGKPLANLIAASASALAGDNQKARVYYTGLLQHKSTELAGIEGILATAQGQDNTQQIDFAKKALKLQPNNTAAIITLLKLYIRTQQWAEAQLFMQQFSPRKWLKITGNKADFITYKSAIIYLHACKQQADGNIERAYELANETHKISPSFIPATILAAELALQLAHPRIAASICQRGWKAAPHPDIVEAYCAIYNDNTQKKRLKRIIKLANYNSQHSLSHQVLAKAYLADNIFDKARNHCKLAMIDGQTATLCLLMAQIEQSDPDGLTENSYKWQNKAEQSPEDALWMCDSCGFIVGKKWDIECPHCHEIATSQWLKAKSYTYNS